MALFMPFPYGTDELYTTVIRQFPATWHVKQTTGHFGWWCGEASWPSTPIGEL